MSILPVRGQLQTVGAQFSLWLSWSARSRPSPSRCVRTPGAGTRRTLHQHLRNARRRTTSVCEGQHGGGQQRSRSRAPPGVWAPRLAETTVMAPAPTTDTAMPGEADRIPTGHGNHALMKYPVKEAASPRGARPCPCRCINRCINRPMASPLGAPQMALPAPRAEAAPQHEGLAGTTRALDAVTNRPMGGIDRVAGESDRKRSAVRSVCTCSASYYTH